MSAVNPVTRLDPAIHAYRYCPHCRTELDLRDEGGVPRPACPSCGFVQYLSPAPGAAVILLRADRICLVRRKYPPKAGQWSLPAGFQEYNEDSAGAALREVREETGLVVRLGEVFAVHTGVLPPDRSVLVVIYRADEIGGRLQAADDAEEVGFYPLDQLPGPIAFAIHRSVLSDLRIERGLPPLKGTR